MIAKERGFQQTQAGNGGKGRGGGGNENSLYLYWPDLTPNS